MAHNTTNITNTSTVHHSVHLTGVTEGGVSNPTVDVTNNVTGDRKELQELLLLTPPGRQFVADDGNPRSADTNERLRANDHGREPYTKGMVFGLGRDVDPRQVLSHAAAAERYGQNSTQAHLAAAREENGKRRIRQFFEEGGCSPVDARGTGSRTVLVNFSPDYGCNAQKMEFDTPEDARHARFGPPQGPSKIAKGNVGGIFGNFRRQAQPSGYTVSHSSLPLALEA